MAKQDSADLVTAPGYVATPSGAVKEGEASTASKYNGERRWTKPSKRAKGYAEERKVKVHKWGQKEGKQLTDYESGIRSGYLQCQSDHAGMYKYKKALEDGKSKAEAIKISRQRGKG